MRLNGRWYTFPPYDDFIKAAETEYGYKALIKYNKGETYLMQTDYAQRPLVSVQRESCAVMGNSLLKRLQEKFPVYGIVADISSV